MIGYHKDTSPFLSGPWSHLSNPCTQGLAFPFLRCLHEKSEVPFAFLFTLLLVKLAWCYTSRAHQCLNHSRCYLLKLLIEFILISLLFKITYWISFYIKTGVTEALSIWCMWRHVGTEMFGGYFFPNLSVVIVPVVAVLGCQPNPLDRPRRDFFFLIP